MPNIGLLLGLLLLGLYSCRLRPKAPSSDLEPDKKASESSMVEVEDDNVLNWSPVKRQATATHYFLMGEYAAMNGQIPQAKTLFEKAYNLDPNPFLGLKFLTAEAGSGHLAEALLLSRRMVLLYPKDADLKVLEAQLLNSSGAFDKAQKAFEAALRLDAKKPEAYAGLIAALQQQKKPEEALVVAQDLVKMDQSNPDAWYLLAKLYLNLHQKDKALRPAKMAYELQSSDSEKIVLYALTLELNGQAKQAVSLYESLYRLNPSNEELIARMLDLYRKLGDLKDALILLNELEKENPTPHPAVKMQKAFVLWELGRFDEASEILIQLHEQYPENDRLAYLAGLGLEKKLDFAKALKSYELVPQKSPFYTHAQYRVIVIYRELKRLPEALTKALNLLSQKLERPVDVIGLYVHLLGDLERYGEAQDFLAEQYKKYPDQLSLLFLRGVFQEKLKDREGCIKTMLAVIEKDPSYASAYNFIGYLWAERGENLDQAEKYILKALSLKPDDGYFLDSLGWVYYQRKDYPRALQIMHRSVEKLPEEAVIMEHLADIYKALGRIEEYKSWLEKASRAKGEALDLTRIKKRYEEAQNTPR